MNTFSTDSTSSTPRSCTACGSSDLLTVTIELSSGSIAFRTCQGCELKWWEQQGESIPFDRVRSMVATGKPPGRGGGTVTR